MFLPNMVELFNAHEKKARGSGNKSETRQPLFSVKCKQSVEPSGQSATHSQLQQSSVL